VPAIEPLSSRNGIIGMEVWKRDRSKDRLNVVEQPRPAEREMQVGSSIEDYDSPILSGCLQLSIHASITTIYPDTDESLRRKVAFPERRSDAIT